MKLDKKDKQKALLKAAGIYIDDMIKIQSFEIYENLKEGTVHIEVPVTDDDEDWVIEKVYKGSMAMLMYKADL